MTHFERLSFYLLHVWPPKLRRSTESSCFELRYLLPSATESRDVYTGIVKRLAESTDGINLYFYWLCDSGKLDMLRETLSDKQVNTFIGSLDTPS